MPSISGSASTLLYSSSADWLSPAHEPYQRQRQHVVVEQQRRLAQPCAEALSAAAPARCCTATAPTGSALRVSPISGNASTLLYSNSADWLSPARKPYQRTPRMPPIYPRPPQHTPQAVHGHARMASLSKALMQVTDTQLQAHPCQHAQGTTHPCGHQASGRLHGGADKADQHP